MLKIFFQEFRRDVAPCPILPIAKEGFLPLALDWDMFVLWPMKGMRGPAQMFAIIFHRPRVELEGRLAGLKGSLSAWFFTLNDLGPLSFVLSLLMKRSAS